MLFALILQSFFAFAHQPFQYEGFVPVQKDREVYVQYKKPRNHQPTLVLLNGLTYSTHEWDKFTDQMESINPDLGLLRYDMQGQGETLLEYKDNFSNSVFVDQDALPYKNQVENLNELFKHFHLPADSTYLIGLSYGGAIAMNYLAKYPNKFQSVILLAPFTSALSAVEEWVKKQMELTRLNPFNPLNTLSDEDLYEYYLRTYVYTFFPVVEPITLENPYKLEAAYRLTTGVRQFKAVDVAARFKKNSVHLFVGAKDEYIKQEEFFGFWSKVPQKAKMSFVTFTNSRHKLPEEKPSVIAEYVNKVLTHDPELSGGQELTVEVEY
ncbi:MAG: alpha/beta hydrolase [Bdellovibrionales bacterium]|nr:alpha/beta hydrolase [Bdellovibrionales bacterium]